MGLVPPVITLEVELASPLRDIKVGQGYRGALVLVRLMKRPVGRVVVPVRAAVCRADDILEAVFEGLPDSLVRALVRNRLARPLPAKGATRRELLELDTGYEQEWPDKPIVTVAVCTRDRSDHLRGCLASLARLSYPRYEVLVVDNAPTSTATRDLVEAEFPDFRCVTEPEPGLSNARNHAIRQATGDIIAFTDDDARADVEWLDNLVAPFTESNDVAVVTGLVEPAELETEPQIILESRWSLSRGYERNWHRIDRWSKHRDYTHLVAYQYGAGANMALRRSACESIGDFSPLLGAGTRCGAGEDLDYFFRALEHGFELVYEPSALIHHFHRREFDALHRQVSAWVAGYSAFLAHTFLAYPAMRWRLGRFMLTNWWSQVRQFVGSSLLPERIPRTLTRAETAASFRGAVRYMRLHGRKNHGRQDTTHCIGDGSERDYQVAVREMELSGEAQPILDVTGYRDTRVFYKLDGHLLGQATIHNAFGNITVSRLLDEASHCLGLRIMSDHGRDNPAVIWASVLSGLRQKLIEGLTHDISPAAKPSGDNPISVSVIIATHNRHRELARCLDSLARQDYEGRWEIVVVDDHSEPAVQATAANGVDVRTTRNSGRGTSAARNEGIRSGRGSILVFIDDDVVTPPGWLKATVRNFERNDVHIVTGNVIPMEMETRAQRMFEDFIGLGCGYEKKFFGPDVFFNDKRYAVPVWCIGAGANLAFRRTLLEETGEFDPRLGPGTATRAGEDLEFLYRAIKSGWTIAYDPGAYVQHQHRRDMAGMLKQMFNYGIGFSAFQCSTLLRNGDTRALRQMLLVVPGTHLRRLAGMEKYPRLMTLVEMAGNILGPLAYLFSSVGSGKRRTEPRLAEISCAVHDDIAAASSLGRETGAAAEPATPGSGGVEALEAGVEARQ